MARADLHCHSKFSNRPTEWFLQRLGSAESYTEPEYIYRTMKTRGMDFVTVTDHNKIDASIILNEKYPEDTFTGVESTVYFPEDGCKIHCLVYGLNQKQFQEIQRHRRDIYDFRDYLRQENLAHSVAHATYSVNSRLNIEHLEKLILLFDVFEGINGGRGKLHNQTWVNALEGLSPERMDELYSKHKIEPFSSTSWVKGFTGGSDDHAGLFLGNTFTITKAKTPQEFLEQIKKKQTRHSGNYSSFHSLAFTVYKIAYDFTRNHKNMKGAESFFSNITSYIFENKKPTFIERLKMKTLMIRRDTAENRVKRLITELVEDLRNFGDDGINRKLSIVYEKATDIADEYAKMALSGLTGDANNYRPDEIVRSVTSSLPGIFLSIPFFTSFGHMYKDRHLLDELEHRFNVKSGKKQKKILWFTDTITDLNGVSVTLRTIGRLAYEKGFDLRLVSCLSQDEIDHRIPPNYINLKPIFSAEMPYYNKLTVKIPSVLKALEDIYNFDPDEIYISTPGPVGLVGLLASKLLNVKSNGIYHTDFTKEVYKITSNDSLKILVETYTRWFFDSVSELKTTSKEYMSILAERGISKDKMTIFKRGIDAKLFIPMKKEKSRFFTLAYAGRISQDKNIDFLLEVFDQLEKRYDNLKLIMAGDGPYIETLKEKIKDRSNIVLLNEIDHARMPEVYAQADLFTFPSTTDTFGMVVLEAQACGLPAIVSDEGGPQEIIRHNETGLVATADSVDDWLYKISYMIDLSKEHTADFNKFGENARSRVISVFDWDSVLNEIFAKEMPEPMAKTFKKLLKTSVA